MTDKSTKQQAGLVKSLLFPAYTDAGANENFQAQDGAQSESDATTAIHDNRTLSGGTETTTTPQHEQDNEISPPLDDSLLTHTGVSVDGESIPEAAPQSPPLPKRNLGARTESMTTQSGIRPFPTTSPRVVDRSLDQSSVNNSSTAVSSVVGVNFLNESSSNANDAPNHGGGDDEPTPVKDNRSSLNLQDSSVFQPRLLDNLGGGDSSSDVFSDVLSTASEMGTVINADSASQRLADVQAMAALMEKSNGSADPLYESESGASDLPMAKNVPELSLPTLEGQRTTEPTSRDSRSSVFREKMDSVFRDRGGGTSTPPPPPPTDGESPSSATAMVSAAIRRIGSGVTSHLPGHSSAPTTPRIVPPSPRVEDYLRSSLSSQRSTEQSSSSVAHLLRSPGSAVHFQADGSRRQRYVNLAPRFSRSSNQATTTDTRGTSLRHANSLSSPLRFARGCLSFDNTIENRHYDNPSIPENEPTSPLMHYLKGAPRSPVKQSRSWDVTSATSSQPKTPQGSYRSFNFGKTSPESSSASTAGAFRPAPLTRVRHANGFQFNTTRTAERYGARALNNISPAVANSRSQDTLALRTPQRIEIERDDALDILACLVERSVAFDQELAQSSQVETIEEVDDENEEREEDDNDANSTNTERKESARSAVENENVELTEDDRVSTFADIGVRDVKSPPPTRRRSPIGLLQADSFSSDLTEAVQMIRKISQDYERKMQDSENSDSNATSHSSRMKAVDELLRSHTYAAEMRRAAKSASTWLRSIDRLESTSDALDRRVDFGANVDSESLSQTAASESNSDKQSAGEQEESESENKYVDKIDIVTLRAMLHSAELRAKEKEDMALRLNEELSKCRAEIGRLQTATRSEKVLFASPNRSILDNDDDSTSSDDATAGDPGANELADAIDCASPISKVDTDKDASIDASFVRSDVVSEKISDGGAGLWQAIADAKREAILLKTALAQANETIKRLQESATKENVDGTAQTDAPVIPMDNTELSKLLDDYKEAVRKELVSKSIQTPMLDAIDNEKKSAESSPDKSGSRMVNARMLEEENFVTDWDDLVEPLPPPPDHGLRSPIVGALLQQWTSDASMHDSLLAWMERIMNGADCETIPPLTISALDHEIRDGFAMHVLPLLLRRSDIHIDVKTRSHRRTHYDMSVSVTSSVLQENTANRASAESLERATSTEKANKTHMMAFNASRGSQSVVDESMQADVGGPSTPYNVSDYLRTSSYAHSSSDKGSDSVTHSTTTALATNSSKRFAGERPATTASQQRSLDPIEHHSRREAERDMDAVPSHMKTAMFSDDVSTSSSTTGGSQKSAPSSGIMGTLGGAFGGLLRRKPSEPEPFYGESGFDDNHFITDEADAVPSFLRHAPPQSPSRSEPDDGQPYHRVVSAPPGRIGVTFVDYRGHAMVSDVAPESPLSGWVFPSDILIAIDEVPVSGMRVRDIIKLLTSRKERQRALRVISSHAMNEFTLNTTTPSEAGVIS